MSKQLPLFVPQFPLLYQQDQQRTKTFRKMHWVAIGIRISPGAGVAQVLSTGVRVVAAGTWSAVVK